MGALGVASLVLRSLTITVTAEYVDFVLRADDDGEGGVLALTALGASSTETPRSRRGPTPLPARWSIRRSAVT